MALTIRYIRYEPADPIVIAEERLPIDDPNAAVDEARARLPRIRTQHSTEPPNGFVVVDEDGRELRRWIETEQ